MLVVGLTGGIGSGKSVVADCFMKLGVPIIDADHVARHITMPGMPATKLIVDHFGHDVLQSDGSLNRGALRQQIFNDADQRQWLEELLHPLILQDIQRQISEIKAPYCITVIPLLFEVDYHHFVNRTLVVDASEETQLQRTIARDKISRETAMKMLLAQAKRNERLEKANDVIQNDGGLAELMPQVEKLHQKYLEMAKDQ
jgi:dephospho-CoA kinase